nr:helix-turn-helix domain-containing protein [Azospirillum aestuarii]
MAPMTSLDVTTAARCFAELGHPTRLAIYQRLVQAGDGGMTVGAIGEEMGVPASTLSHHLKQLMIVGLIEQVREGRILHCRPLYPQMEGLVRFLTEQCCARPMTPRAAEAETGAPGCC